MMMLMMMMMVVVVVVVVAFICSHSLWQVVSGVRFTGRFNASASLFRNVAVELCVGIVASCSAAVSFVIRPC